GSRAYDRNVSKLLLLDGHSLAYRAFYALPTDLATRTGTITNAVYGFTSMLIKMLGDEKPEYIAVAFDTGAPTFRDEMDAEYKAGRKETPDVFSSQLPLIHEVLEALAIPTLEVEGVEADDVIATLAEQAAAEGIDTVIVTGDRDTYQLVRDPHVKVLYNRRGVSDYVLYDEAGIVERTGGVTAAQYPDYAALRGDLRQRSWDSEQVRVLFDQLEFRTLLPRLFEAVGEEAAEPEAESFDADVAIVPDPAAAATRLRDLGAVDNAYVLEGRWEADAG